MHFNRKNISLKRVFDIIKSILPDRFKTVLRNTHRNYVFGRAIKQFMNNPSAYSRSGNNILGDLIYGWGNEDWSALGEYLAACLNHAIKSNGPILECGSGLSTILIGVIATKRGIEHWALEHNREWAEKVRNNINKYKLKSVFLHECPLKDYGSFCWYDPPLESMPTFALIICDGPPGETKGGRYGLVPIMLKKFQSGSVILLDDAGREPERLIATHWKNELKASLEVLGSVKPYIRLVLNINGLYNNKFL